MRGTYLVMTENFFEERAMNALVDLVMMKLREEKKDADLDSLERYALNVKNQFYNDSVRFRYCFIRGYQVLLEELCRH